MSSIARREVSCDWCANIAVVGLTARPDGWDQLKDSRDNALVFDLCESCSEAFNKFVG